MIELMTAMVVSASPEWSRDQARLELLSRWGDRIVAISDRVFELDLGKGLATPVQVPGIEKVQFVAGDSVRFAVGVTAGKVMLRRETSSGWADVALPSKLAAAVGKPVLRLGASGDRVALLWVTIQETKPPKLERGLAFFDGAKWLELTIEPGAQGLPKYLELHGGRWYVGYSRGEWGGSLWQLDEAKGALKEIPFDHLPIVGLASRGSSLFVGSGLAHMGLLDASVRELRADGTWKDLVSSAKALGWPKPGSLEGLDLDEEGRLIAVSGTLGLLRLEKGVMTSLGMEWPADHVYADGLVVTKEAYVVGTFDSGVVVAKRAGKTWKRIALAR